MIVGRRATDVLPAAPQPPGLPTPRTFWPLCIAVVVLPLLAAAEAAWSSWRDLQAETESRLTRTVQMLHENTLRALESQEAYLTAVNRFIMDLDWDAISASPDVAEFLASLRDSAPGTSAIGIIAPNGQLVQTSSRTFPFQPIDLSFRDYLLAHQGGESGATEPFVGRAILGQVRGRLIFPISHARRDRQGMSDGGALWSTSDVNNFAGFYASIVFSPSDTVQLIRHDSSILVRHPVRPATMAECATVHEEKMAVIRTAARTGQVATSYMGTAWFPAALHGTAFGAEWLVAARWFERYGIAIVYGLDVDQMRRAWVGRASGFAVAALTVMLLLLLVLIRLAQTGMRR